MHREEPAGERSAAEVERDRGIPAERRALVAHALAGTPLALLAWWVAHDMRETPEQMDAHFHRLVWSGAGSSSG